MPPILLSASELKRWKAEILLQGFPDRWSEAYLYYMDSLNDRGLPIIFEAEHLALLVGLKPQVLYWAINVPTDFYRSFEMPKRSGGTRTIEAPLPSLLLAQRWISENILSSVRVHEAAHGYVSGRSHITHACNHISGQHCFKADLQDFFGSISFDHVENVFRRMGYLPLLASQMAGICCLHGRLPQGAATSPTLSNIIAWPLDRVLSELADDNNIIYTRYSDDLCFSGPNIILQFTEIVERTVESFGFRLNREKSMLMREGGRRIITGISLSSGSPKPPRSFRRKARQDVHRIVSKGVMRASVSGRSFNPLFADSVLGKMNYWASVDPTSDFAKSSKSKIEELMKDVGGTLL